MKDNNLNRTTENGISDQFKDLMDSNSFEIVITSENISERSDESKGEPATEQAVSAVKENKTETVNENNNKLPDTEPVNR